MSEPLSFKDKLIIIGFMGFALAMLAIGGLLDILEFPLRSPKEKIK